MLGNPGFFLMKIFFNVEIPYICLKVKNDY